MVAIDRYRIEKSALPLSTLLRPLSFEMLRPVLTAPLYLFRRTDRERLARDLKVADRISDAAGRPTELGTSEPHRLGVHAMTAVLQPMADDVATAQERTVAATRKLEADLARIDYELSSIREDIAPYMPR